MAAAYEKDLTKSIGEAEKYSRSYHHSIDPTPATGFTETLQKIIYTYFFSNVELILTKVKDILILLK